MKVLIATFAILLFGRPQVHADPALCAVDEKTASLKSEFEKAWLPHVTSYTNYTTAGMADDYWDMQRFIKEWKPRIIHNQVDRETDSKLRERMAEWMVPMKSIDDLYYGLLIPHEELMRRWAAYESIKNSKIIVHDEELQLKGGRATWMSREYDNCEMAATIRKNFVWKDGQSEVYAFVHTDVACESCSCALLSYWLVRYRDGRFVSSHRIPNNDVEWFPCLNGAPYGRKYTLVVHKKTVEVVNCVTGKVVLTVERKGCARWKCE